MHSAAGPPLPRPSPSRSPRDRPAHAPKKMGRLGLSILLEFEVVLRQPGHRMRLLVRHRHIQQDQMRAFVKGIDAAFSLDGL